MTARATGGGRTAARRATAAGAKARPAAAPLVFAKRPAAAEQDRIPLFEVDGTEYAMPAVVPTGDALLYLLNVNGMATEAQKGLYLIRELAGPEALVALLGEADMQPADWHRLIKRVTEHAFGSLEGPGN